MELTDSFLGTGWAFPPEFGLVDHSTRMVTGVRDIQESLHILLSTLPEERVVLPAYGCDLSPYLFRELTPGLAEEVRDTVMTAIRLWEPRIEADCDVTVDPERAGILRIEVVYRLARAVPADRHVFLFELHDGVPVRVE